MMFLQVERKKKGKNVISVSLNFAIIEYYAIEQHDNKHDKYSISH